MPPERQIPPPLPAPFVTVVVVNWNRCNLLRACLQSLAAQMGVSERFDVVLVDNGSTDGSVEMADREFGGSPAFRLRVIRNQRNLGFCEANNQGMEAAASPYIALLNNDAEAEPGWLAALCAALEAEPGAGMAASKILVWETPERIDKVGHLIYLDGQNRGRGTGELDLGQYDEPGEALWPDGCACLYRRRMIEEIGGFDEDFFAYADDAELGLRARIAGCGCVYVPAAVVRHHRGATLGLANLRRLELIERNRVLLVAKLFPWRLVWLNGVFYLARLAAGALAALRNKGEVNRFPGPGAKLRVLWTMAKADWQALWMLPRMFAKRRKLTPLRKLSSGEIIRLLWRYRITLRELSEQSN
ncbi:MAG: glycosyltransferase family 2 protein [Bryobacterales bacterium]|nr:glycosyltransferase family 2 protein [Bryobacterales bacterium]